MFPDRENMLHVLQLIAVTSERALLSFLSHCYLQKSKPHKGTLRKSVRGGVLGPVGGGGGVADMGWDGMGWRCPLCDANRVPPAGGGARLGIRKLRTLEKAAPLVNRMIRSTIGFE